MVEAAAVEDERELAISEDLTNGGDDVGHGLGQVGRQLLVQVQQRPAVLVADEVGVHAGHREAVLGAVELLHRALARVGLHVPVDVEVPGGDDARLDPAPSEPSAEIGRVQLGHHRLELATQRLHARSPVRPDERPELRSTKVLDRLDRRLSEQCHEQQAECHRPHSEDDRTGKREAPACRVHEPECLDRREVESEPHVTAPRVLRKCGWWVEAIRLEGTILTELWLDESTRRARGPNLGIVSLCLVLLRVATVRVVVARAVEQLRHNRRGPVLMNETPDVQLRQAYSCPLLHEADQSGHVHLVALGTDEINDLRRHLVRTFRTRPRGKQGRHASVGQPPLQATDGVPMTSEGACDRYVISHTGA